MSIVKAAKKFKSSLLNSTERNDEQVNMLKHENNKTLDSKSNRHVIIVVPNQQFECGFRWKVSDSRVVLIAFLTILKELMVILCTPIR